MTDFPTVAVIMPVLNEEQHLPAAVVAINQQEYPHPFSVVLAIGPSSDRTQEVAEVLAKSAPNLKIVPNPSGRTPDALNAAIAATDAQVVVRVDAHSELSPGYIKRAVETLARTGADNVGGIMDAVGVTSFEQAVAAAMTSPLGVGNAAFHVGGQEGPAQTVYLGVFKRSALDRVGGYDPHFTRAQDWEMNHRIRQTGGLVWFDPQLRVTYRPRPSVRKLAKQYFQYGQWRREVMRSHPETTKSKANLRYFAPPLAVLGSVVGKLLFAAGLVLENSLLKAGLILPFGYLAIVLLASLSLVSKARSGARFLPLVLLTMQVSWGVGFLTSRRKR